MNKEWAIDVYVKVKSFCLYQGVMDRLTVNQKFVVRQLLLLLSGLQSGGGVMCKLDIDTTSSSMWSYGATFTNSFGVHWVQMILLLPSLVDWFWHDENVGRDHIKGVVERLKVLGAATERGVERYYVDNATLCALKLKVLVAAIALMRCGDVRGLFLVGDMTFCLLYSAVLKDFNSILTLF